ncbi:hypothetical protein WJX72_009311 [[Myrmecia] bisecta]|uniref:Uncharacterized protein n=1 Tax=[Myrmecia] bisecta TaxID=41462 RepID=A0AAW1PHW6_9CHLO
MQQGLAHASSDQLEEIAAGPSSQSAFEPDQASNSAAAGLAGQASSPAAGAAAAVGTTAEPEARVVLASRAGTAAVQKLQQQALVLRSLEGHRDAFLQAIIKWSGGAGSDRALQRLYKELGPKKRLHDRILRGPLTLAVTDTVNADLPVERRVALLATLLRLYKGKAVSTERNNNQSSPLHVACHFGHVEVVSSLLAHDSKADAINLLTKSGWAPLHVAANKGHTDIVHLLLTHPHTKARIGVFQIEGVHYDGAVLEDVCAEDQIDLLPAPAGRSDTT